MHYPTTPSHRPIAVTIVLWSARVLTCAILSFWAFFIAAHLLGAAGAASRPLTPADYTSLITMAASLVGLGLALRWSRLGAAITLINVAIGAFVNWRFLLFPATLIPLTAALLLLVSFLQHTARRPDAVPVQ